jgi:D-glycero-D-manno-heptose 1,7-bisphosphate phosphatase
MPWALRRSGLSETVRLLIPRCFFASSRACYLHDVTSVRATGAVAKPGRPAVFLDRDGVILEEAGFVTDPEDIRILTGVAQALERLQRAGFELVVVTNQTAIARGLVSEDRVAQVHQLLRSRLEQATGARIGGFYVCPHHPSADLAEYRVACDCRKPRPGLLLRAASELGLDLRGSFMVGDRVTDIAAGARAGCRTVLVRTGAHLEPPIEVVEPLEPDLAADFECDDLPEAVNWITKMA